MSDAHVHLASFDPPPSVRLYPDHLGRRVVIGWIIVTDSPLAEVAEFRLKLSSPSSGNSNRQHNIHTVKVESRGVCTWSQTEQALANLVSARLLSWIRGQDTMAVRATFSPMAEDLLTSKNVRFLPAFAKLPDNGKDPVGWFVPPDSLSWTGIDWDALRLLMHEEPALAALQRGLDAAGTTSAELRASSMNAVATGQAVPPTCDVVRKGLIARVVYTKYNQSGYLVTDVDPVRSIASHMPRRSQRESIRSFTDYLSERWEIRCEDCMQPLFAVGSRICDDRCCLVDESDLSARDRFAGVTVAATSPASQQRHHTFVVPEACVLTGFVAETSPEHISALLPQIAWNVAVSERLAQLERHLGHTFRSKAMLRQALTHEAFSHALDRGVSAQGVGRSYERLEWLGDAVLQALASLHTFHRMPPNTSASHLSDHRTKLCSNAHLLEVACRLQLGEMVLLRSEGNGSSEAGTNGVSRKMQADVVEALLGSVYLEGGWSAAVRFFEDFILNEDMASAWHTDEWTDAAAEGAALAARVSAACVRVEQTIGLTFHGRKARLQHALLHPSSLHPGCMALLDLPPQFNRLEYLGDALIGLVVSEELYHRFEEDTEFHLSERRKQLVCNDSLQRVAETLSLDRLVVHEPSALGVPPGKWLADSLEALAAAVYFEGGQEALKSFVTTRLLADYFHREVDRPAKRARVGEEEKHPKCLLQEAAFAMGKAAPQYTVDAASDSQRVVVECRLDDVVVGTGSGANFKDASTESARHAMAWLIKTQNETEHALKKQLSSWVAPRTAASHVDATESGPAKHPKAQFVEFVHLHKLGQPRFEVVADRGPKHKLPTERFVMAAKVDDRVIGQGIGQNQKAASTDAAMQALRVLRTEVLEDATVSMLVKL